MKPINLTDDYLEDIIDSAVIENEQVTFIADGLVTDKILSYALTEYNLSDEESDFEIFDDEDYIVYTIPCHDDKAYSIVIETVQSENGFRNINHDGICYVQECFDKNEIFDCVDADKIVFFEEDFEDDDIEDDNDEKFDACDCEECRREKAYMDFVGRQILQTMNIMEDENVCEKCKFEALLDIFHLGGCGVVSGILSDEFFITPDEE